MAAGITVKMNPSAVKALKDAQVHAIRETAAKMLAEKIDDQQIPMGEGTLQNVLTFVNDAAAHLGRVNIVSEGPYAARLYFNPQYNFNKESNTNARGEWWEDWISGEKKDRPDKLFTYFYKEVAGGYIK